MPRPPKPNPPIEVHVRLPQEVYAPAAAILYSPLEQRIPYGAWNGLVTRLIQDWLQKQQTGAAS